jgi:hypothetical protein
MYRPFQLGKGRYVECGHEVNEKAGRVLAAPGDGAAGRCTRWSPGRALVVKGRAWKNW